MATSPSEHAACKHGYDIGVCVECFPAGNAPIDLRELEVQLRDAVKVTGPLGPNSEAILLGGGSVRLNGKEASEAAVRLLPWISSLQDAAFAAGKHAEITCSRRANERVNPCVSVTITAMPDVNEEDVRPEAVAAALVLARSSVRSSSARLMKREERKKIAIYTYNVFVELPDPLENPWQRGM